ncbi:MAG: translocation/assembly module TamB domain-containing protein [Candidatus Zixiibacteriota bacterium]
MKTRSFLKYFVIIAGSLVGLLAIAIASTQTSMFRDWLRGKIEQQGNKRINGQLTIGSLEGSLFTSVQLGNILVKDQSDTVLFIKSVRVLMSPMQILYRAVAIDSVYIEDPYLKLIQAPDSSWNISHIRRVDSSAGEPVPASEGKSSLRYLVGDFLVKNGRVGISSLDTTLPSLVSEFGARFKATYADTAMVLNLTEFGFLLDRPGFRLVRLSVNAVQREGKLTLSDLSVETAKNQLQGGGIYTAADSSVSSGTLASKPIDFSEFRAFMPGFIVNGSPVFEIETHLIGDSLAVTLGVTEGSQRIDLGIDIALVSTLINATTRDQAHYHISGRLTEFGLAHWLPDSLLDYSANGTFSLSGQGLTARTAVFAVAADLNDLRALGRPIGGVTLKGQYDRGRITGDLDASGTFGKVTGGLGVDSVLGDQHYSGSFLVQHLDLAPLLQNDSMHSELNLTARFDGRSFDPATLAGKAIVDMSASSVYGVAIDTMFGRFQFDGSSYRIDTLQFRSSLGTLSSSASGKYAGVVTGAYDLVLSDLGALGKLAGQDSLGGQGRLNGKAEGSLDSLHITSDFEFQHLKYGDYGVDSLSGSASISKGLKSASSIYGTATVLASQLHAIGNAIDSVRINSEFGGTEVTTNLNLFYQQGIEGHVTGVVAIDSPTVVDVPSIALTVNSSRWTGGSPDTRIAKRGDRFEIRNLNLSAPQTSGIGEQTVALNGIIGLSGDEEVHLAITRLDLAEAAHLFNMTASVGGSLSLDTKISGTASGPKIAGTMSIDSGVVNQFSYQTWHTTFSYVPEDLTWNMALIPYVGDSLTVAGRLPVHVALDGTLSQLYRDRAIDITVLAKGLPLSILQASGQPFKQTTGTISADAHATGTMNAPTIVGKIGLHDAAVSIPKYGIEYSDIAASMTVTNQEIQLDTLHIHRDQGLLTGSGTLQFQDNLMTGSIKTTQIDFLADKFYAVRHKDYQIQISGDAHITGDQQSPKFAGSITILKSMFYLPAVMAEAAAQQAALYTSTPMLVKATMKPDSLGDSTALALAKKAELDSSGSDWYNNLRGQFKLAIPKNTWIKGPDMNLEIGEGDIDLVKNGPSFEIFGPIKVLRGQYNLYGKRFTILQGNLLFTGGAEYNPEITMEAQYVFRTADREKRTLKVDISGKAFSPVLKFTIDDNVIEERDAIAYVMYGRSMDELTSGQKSQTGSAQGELAKGAAANMLAGQLSQTLGSKLGLDVVDISSQGSLSSATLTVGKYLTGNLFMSYSRGIGQSQDQEPVPQIVTLEYELSKYLFLQLLQGDEKSSGADLIFKYQH